MDSSRPVLVQHKLTKNNPQTRGGWILATTSCCVNMPLTPAHWHQETWRTSSSAPCIEHPTNAEGSPTLIADRQPTPPDRNMPHEKVENRANHNVKGRTIHEPGEHHANKRATNLDTRLALERLDLQAEPGVPDGKKRATCEKPTQKSSVKICSPPSNQPWSEPDELRHHHHNPEERNKPGNDLWFLASTC